MYRIIIIIIYTFTIYISCGESSLVRIQYPRYWFVSRFEYIILLLLYSGTERWDGRGKPRKKYTSIYAFKKRT